MMAYSTKELEKLALIAIEKHKLRKIEQLICYVPCSRATFYNHKLDELDSIKEALFKVKESKKLKMTDKWENSDNPTLQIAAFKLMADDDELAKLNSQKTEIEHSFKDTPLKIGFENDSNEE